jgi:hypothetical protein
LYTKLVYITIQTGENEEQALSKIKRQVGHLNLSVWNRPIKLTGNFKVLELHSKGNKLIKVDGPGFIIDKLFEYFFN